MQEIKEPGVATGLSKIGSESDYNTPKNNFKALGAVCIWLWLYILTTFGIDAKFLTGHHGPCPACGGTDRFRFDDKEGRGTFFCSNCGAGDGFRLLQLVFGWTPAQCLHEVAVLMGLKTGRTFNGTMPTPPAPTAKPESARLREKNKQRLNAIYLGTVEATPGTETHHYLTTTRAIPLASIPAALRHHPALDYWEPGKDGKPRNRGKYPAMVAMILDPNGKPVGLHLTYLTPDGKKVA